MKRKSTALYRLVPGGRGDLSGDRQMGKKGGDFRRLPSRGMAFSMAQDKAANPVDIASFRPDTVMFQANAIADLIQQTCLGRFHGFHPGVFMIFGQGVLKFDN